MTLTDKAASFARTETEEGTVGDVPEMVERVARALSKRNREDPDQVVFDIEELCRSPRWRIYIGAARTAIAAMREPTEAMARAAWLEDFDEIWPLAINAALGNPPVAR